MAFGSGAFEGQGGPGPIGWQPLRSERRSRPEQRRHGRARLPGNRRLPDGRDRRTGNYPVEGWDTGSREARLLATLNTQTLTQTFASEGPRSPRRNGPLSNALGGRHDGRPATPSLRQRGTTTGIVLVAVRTVLSSDPAIAAAQQAVITAQQQVDLALTAAATALSPGVTQRIVPPAPLTGGSGVDVVSDRPPGSGDQANHGEYLKQTRHWPTASTPLRAPCSTRTSTPSTTNPVDQLRTLGTEADPAKPARVAVRRGRRAPRPRDLSPLTRRPSTRRQQGVDGRSRQSPRRRSRARSTAPSSRSTWQSVTPSALRHRRARSSCRAPGATAFHYDRRRPNSPGDPLDWPTSNVPSRFSGTKSPGQSPAPSRRSR